MEQPSGARTMTKFETRRARPSDAERIASAHLDSIQSIGRLFYPPTVVDDWAEGLTGDAYVNAMNGGEIFFVALAQVDGAETVLGFSSDYVREGSQHGTSVYVRGDVARKGVGTALLQLAQAEAVARGATTVYIEASLAGVPFYKANGFVEVSRGHTQLRSGRPIECVFMQKVLR
jgi:GNAT superfamily N-acetyltransferase